MQVISKRTLKQFWEKHPQVETPLKVWFVMVSKAEWSGPADVKAMFGSADFLGDSRVIFDIGGNKFRLVARIAYRFKRVMVKFVGTHKEYDEINPEVV
jgi:mRNA interferase HigB